MKIFQLPLAFLMLFSIHAEGQGFELVFPGMSGPVLIDSVGSHYRPGVVLDYANARDTLYGKVLAIDDDSVRCIYSGHTLYLDPTADPTQYIYLNGATNGMNAEHAYPQSKGAADGNARSDMHHLYPARIPVNEARASEPYGDIPDATTQKWFIGNTVQTTIPTNNINGYSEFKTGKFEPREAVKGDLARSVFYFYTMYREQANAADPNFFELQRPTLCQWNAMDPADSIELRKTWRIAHYQEGKPNPYVIDCTLANRTWCPDIAPVCLSGTKEPAAQALAIKLSPQPTSGIVQMSLNLPFKGNITGKVFSILGQELSSFYMKDVPSGDFSMPIDFSNLDVNTEFLGFLQVEIEGASGRLHQVVPFVVNR